jgi:hypothetical protein
MTFTCSTLRKRLRLISISSGTLGANTTSSSSNGTGRSPSLSVEQSRGQTLKNLARTPVYEEHSEPADYFGDAANPSSSDAAESPLPLSRPAKAVDSIMSPPREAMIAAQSDGLTAEMLNTRYPDGSSFDWTRLPITPALPRHIQLARSIDWASTPLGPIETWKFDLRAMCNLVMGSPHVSTFSFFITRPFDSFVPQFLVDRNTFRFCLEANHEARLDSVFQLLQSLL